eukprot:107956-Karenia_brevis.AAC.1
MNDPQFIAEIKILNALNLDGSMASRKLHAKASGHEADVDMSPGDDSLDDNGRQERFANAKKSSLARMCYDKSKSGPEDDQWVLIKTKHNSKLRDIVNDVTMQDAS